MNVLYLTMNPNRLSTTAPTEGWLKLLPPQGLRPVLVSRTLGAFHQWVESQGYPVYHDSLSQPNKRNPLPFLRSMFQLRKIIRKHRIDLIHANEQDIYPAAQYAGRLCGKPVVVSIHFTMERDYCKWAFGGRRMPARMFFVSKANQENCSPSLEGVVDSSRFRVLYNGIDMDAFRPDDKLRKEFRAPLLTSEDIAIGVACALRPRKQLEHLFQAASMIDDPRVKVVLAGAPVAGDEAYAENLLKNARGLLGDRLIELGHITEMRPFYNGLDIFVNTSQEEACSMSVIESLACGCPVLGYPSKSVDDQILPQGGEITPQDDVNKLAKALRAWVADAPLLQKRRDLARERALEKFDIRAGSAMLWNEYQAVLNENCKRPSPVMVPK